MHKLYSFLALVFLTACGSSWMDGTYSPSNSSTAIEIKGDKAMVITIEAMCSVEVHDEELYVLVCDDGNGKTFFSASENFLDLVIDGEVVQFLKQK